MILLATLLATSDASAIEYVSTTVARFGRTSSLSSVAMSESGDVCFSRYGSAGGAWYFWRRGDGAPTEISAMGTGSYVTCAAVSDSGYVLAYESDGYSVEGRLFDAYTDDLYALESSGSWGYAAYVNENGYSAGYVLNTEGTAYSPAWWGPTGGEANTFSVAGHDSSYPVGIDDQNRVLAYGSTYNRWGGSTDVLLYDIDRGSAQAFGADLPSGATVQFAGDGDVLASSYTGGPTLKYDFDAEDLDVLDTRPFEYTYVYGTNAAGDVLYTASAPDGTYRAACWNEAWGSVELDNDGSPYSYASYLNDAGQAAGYIYSADGTAMSPALWDCATGELEVIPSPSGATYVYPVGITQDGTVVLYAYGRGASGYTLWVYDSNSGDLRKIADGGERGSVYAYGFSAESGDLLVYQYSGSTGRLDYLRRVD